MTTTSPAVLTRAVAPDNIAWGYLDAAGYVSGLTYEWDYPGGPTSAQCDLHVPPAEHVPALRNGSTVTLHRGTQKAFAGRVAKVDRGAPWQVQIDGLAGLATRETASTTGTLDAIVDAAITAGLPWTRPATLGGASWDGGEGGAGVGQTTLDEVLTSTLTAVGKQWKVDAAGVVSSESQPTTPTVTIRADTTPPTDLNGYATVVTARYRTSNTYGANVRFATVTVTNTTAKARFGRVTKSIDLSGLGVLTSSQATTYAQAYLDRVSPRMTVVGDFDVAAGQILTGSGAPLDLPLIRPGIVARIHLVSLVRETMAVPTTTIDVLVGRTRYDADSGVLTLSPAERTADPLAIMFGGRAKAMDS